MEIIDLDQAKAARAEQQKDPVVVRFGGEEFALPFEFPWNAADSLARGETNDALKQLLGERFDAFMAHEPSVTDVETFLTRITKLTTAQSVGESSASSASSSNTSERSRPISRASTPPISESAPTEVMPVSGV